MKKIFISVFLMAAQTALAQGDGRDVAAKIHYFFNVTSGMMAGEKGRSLTYTASTTHGVVLKSRLRIGAGAGIDSYNDWQTLPIYGQVSYDVIPARNPIFLQASYGWSHAWRPRSESGYFFETDQGGRMFSAMLGYRHQEGRVNLFVAAGYRFQALSTRYNPIPNPAASYLYNYAEKIDYGLERLVLTIGFGWK